MNQSIEGKIFREMFISGANNLQNNKALIDKLNVFPVPDGDTGTNMSLTIASALKELNKVKDDNIEEIGKALAKGSLMGARGNSGVILSQIIRGISKSIEGKTTLGKEDIALALKSGSDTAYKAVIKPIEGTVLTVIRETSDYAVKNIKNHGNMIDFFEAIVESANISLEGTPELLKNLKEAGVVDSGGKGLVCLLEGMLAVLKGGYIGLNSEEESTSEISTSESIKDVDIKYAYCTEFILETDKITSDEMRDKLIDCGDSMVCVGFDGVIKIHIHTNEPGNVLTEALKYGQLVTIKIENMKIQHANQIISDEEHDRVTSSVDIEQVSKSEGFVLNKEKKKYGFITTAMGSGLSEMFEKLGVDVVIEGGQTMNPSTEDFMNAIEMINSDYIFIFPNNGNVIMAANQAKEISDKNIYVVPTKNIPQGIGCLVGFDPDSDPDTNMESFMDSLDSIKSGEITYAVRDTIMDGIEVKEGDIIGITAKKLISSGRKLDAVTRDVISKMIDEDSDILTLYYGENVEEDEARLFAEEIQDEYEDIEVELYYGGQPLYYYLISVE